MLWVTPFLFPTVAVHALASGDFFNYVTVTLLYGTSLCVHGNPALFGPWHPITVVDKALCGIISLSVARSAYKLPLDWRTAFVWFALAYMQVVYYFQISKMPRYDPTKWYPWHTSLHFVTVAGMHALYDATLRPRLKTLEV
jgi:hypothetical protein